MKSMKFRLRSQSPLLAMMALPSEKSRKRLICCLILRDVVVDGFDGHHLAHVGLAGGVADHRRAAAHQGDGAMARALHVCHCHDRDVVADVQGIGGWVEADVERRRVLELFVKLVFKGHLRDKAALFEQVENVLSHGDFLLRCRADDKREGRRCPQKNALPIAIGKA